MFSEGLIGVLWLVQVVLVYQTLKSAFRPENKPEEREALIRRRLFLSLVDVFALLGLAFGLSECGGELLRAENFKFRFISVSNIAISSGVGIGVGILVGAVSALLGALESRRSLAMACILGMGSVSLFSFIQLIRAQL